MTENGKRKESFTLRLNMSMHQQNRIYQAAQRRTGKAFPGTVDINAILNDFFRMHDYEALEELARKRNTTFEVVVLNLLDNYLDIDEHLRPKRRQALAKRRGKRQLR